MNKNSFIFNCYNEYRIFKKNALLTNCDAKFTMYVISLTGTSRGRKRHNKSLDISVDNEVTYLFHDILCSKIY